MIGLGESQWRAGLREARSTLLEAGRRAEDIGRRDLVIEAALAGDRGFFSATANPDPDLIALLTEALDNTTRPTSPRARRSWRGWRRS